MSYTSHKDFISGKLLVRNTLLNFVGQLLSLLVGVVTLPFIVRGLSTERFGLLSLAWVVLGYFTIFDLGLGRATIKYVAEALGRGDKKIVPRIMWTAATIQAIFGLIGTIILVSITPLLVEHILNIPPKLIGEAKAIFYLLSLSIPVVLVSISFQGVLEAAQRFDLVNAVKIPSSIASYLLVLVGLLLGFRLPGIVALILLNRLVALVVLIILDFHLIPELKRYSGSLALFPRLFSFGGWVLVSNVVGPILVYLDRFLIGSLLTMDAVAYYTAPYEAVTRLWIIPASLTMTLFPAFSTLEGVKDRQKLVTLFARAIKYVLLVLTPIVIVLEVFAKEILQIWLGSDFSIESKTVMRLLTFGVLVNSLAHIPFALLQGIGRSDITAKFHLLELPISVGLTWFLIKEIGIQGAALAWTLRVGIDAFLLFGVSLKICRIKFRVFVENGLLHSIISTLIFATVLVMLLSLIKGTIFRFLHTGIIVLIIILLMVATQFSILYTTEKNLSNSFIRQFLTNTIKEGKNDDVVVPKQ
ncbi:MAG: flippase [Candidatus Bathyarchaeia archaeon]